MNALAPISIESRWPHRLAVLLACAAFPLVWIGGLVTTYDAGMAVEDWPNTYGYNLFLYPWKTWIYGPFNLFIEHGHRLFAAVVGMITIAMLVVVWRADRRPWMKAVSAAALLAVIGQGVLGGMRVRLDERQLAMLHGCFGPAFFALTAVIAVMTSRWWHTVQPQRAAAASRIQPLALVVLVLAYGQLVIGALIRHTPVDASYTYFRGAVYFHLFLAMILLGHILWLGVAVRGSSAPPALRRVSATLIGLVCLQILLGAATWIVKFGWPAWSAQWTWNADYTIQTNTLMQSLTVTGHVANGSLVLAFAAVMATCCFRQYGLTDSRTSLGSHRDDPPGPGRRTIIAKGLALEPLPVARPIRLQRSPGVRR